MMGGFATVQQWCRVGDHAMVASQTAVDSDVIPFAIAVGNRACLTGINVIGLSRRGFGEENVAALRKLYRELFRGPGVFRERLAAARAAYKGNEEASQIFDFIDAAGRNGVCQAASSQGA